MSSVEIIKKFLNEQIAADPEMLDIHAYVLGVPDVVSMAKLLVDPLERAGFDATEMLFAASSVGAVFGFRDAGGKRIVLKVFPAPYARRELEQIVKTQQVFITKGFPSPRILGDLHQLSNQRFCLLMEFVEGEEQSGHTPWVRQALAYHLAWFSDIVDQTKLPPIPNPFKTPANRLWPPPFKPGQDFSRTQRGAGFLRDRAMKTRSIIRAADLPQKLAHSDWGCKNARFRDGKLIAVFDWDSLSSTSEAEMVGQAAATFTAHWEIPEKVTPTREEATAFVQDYQEARGRKFTRQEMQVVAAAADYMVAVIGRFEYSGKPHPAGTYGYLARELGSRSLIEV